MDKVGASKGHMRKTPVKHQRFLTKWIHRLGNVLSPFDDEKERKVIHGKDIPRNVSRRHALSGKKKRFASGKKTDPSTESPTTIVVPATQEMWRESRVPVRQEKEGRLQMSSEWRHSHSAGPFSSPPESLILRGISCSMSSGVSIPQIIHCF
jgi:hypothetical protein